VIDTALGLLGLIVFVVCVTGFAAGVTWFVVKIFPTGSKKKPPPEPEAS
jgi:hypothetical protein